MFTLSMLIMRTLANYSEENSTYKTTEINNFSETVTELTTLSHHLNSSTTDDNLMEMKEFDEDKNETENGPKQPLINDDSSGCYELDIFINSYVGILGTIGVIGNTISIRILQGIKTNISSSLLLSALAFWDSAFIMIMIVMRPVIAVLRYFSYIPSVQQAIVYLFAYGYEFLNLALCQCTWVTALVTLHRYIGKYSLQINYQSENGYKIMIQWQIFNRYEKSIVHNFMILYFKSLYFRKHKNLCIFHFCKEKAV